MYQSDKELESCVEEVFISIMKDKFGITGFEIPSEKYKNGLINMLDDVQVTGHDIKKWLHPMYVKKFLHMTKEAKQPILDDIKIKIIMSRLLDSNKSRYPNLNYDELYKKVIEDIEGYI